MRKTPQRSFYPTGNHRHSLECFAGPLAIGECGSIRSQSNPTPRRIGIVVPDLAIRGVVVDHRIHIARADRKKKSRPPKRLPGLATLPIGLRQNAYTKTGRLQHATQNRCGKTGVIDISIPRDEDNIDLVPPAGLHLGTGNRKWLGGLPPGKLF